MSEAVTKNYSGWRRERIGVMFGLSGAQLLVLAITGLPAVFLFGEHEYIKAAIWMGAWFVLVGLVVVPIRGRSALTWVNHLLRSTVGRVTKTSSWVSAASTGTAQTAEDLRKLDLPGPLQQMRVYDGPPLPMQGMDRPAIMKDPNGANGPCWRMTARLTHPGLSLSATGQREVYAEALGQLCANAVRSDFADRISLYVRTVPADASERDEWREEHLRTDMPAHLLESMRSLEHQVISTSVEFEVFVAIEVLEKKVRRDAKVSGGGVEGRARALYRRLPEVQSNLNAAGCEQVAWLTVEGLAEAIRTGYDPNTAAELAAARTRANRGRIVHTTVDLAAAGPTRAPAPAASSYTHGAFVTSSFTILLPELGTQVGRLAPLLSAWRGGERRSIALHYEPLSLEAAQTAVDRDLNSAGVAKSTRERVGFRTRSRDRRQHEVIEHQESVLANGHTIVRVAGVAAVTVSAEEDIRDHAQALGADARSARFQLLGLDLAEDAGFASAVLPLGVGLPARVNTMWGN